MFEMKDMAEENRRLKRMYAEMSMQNDLLKEALEAPLFAPLVRAKIARVKAVSATRDGHECGRAEWG